jgi:hypothetical protein
VLRSLALSCSSSLRSIAVGCLPPQMFVTPRPSSPSRPAQASVTPRFSCESSCYPLTHRSVGGHSNPVVAASMLLPPCHLLSTTIARASSLLHAIGCGSLYCYCQRPLQPRRCRFDVAAALSPFQHDESESLVAPPCHRLRLSLL